MKTKVALPRTRRFRSVRPAAWREAAASKQTPPRLQIRNVLVPIDFSESSLEALRFSAPLLRSFGANLHLVHVAAPDAPMAGLAAMPIVIADATSPDRLKADLKDVAKANLATLEPATIHLERGEPYEEICRLARDLRIDLIVITTRGQTGVKHLLLGSTAERVVRYSPCPVLVVRRRNNSRRTAQTYTGLNFEKILVPIDFSACANQGLTVALNLATQFNSTITLIHSVNLDYYVASEEYACYDFPQLLQQTEKIAQERLQEIAQHLRHDGFDVNGTVRIGHPGQQICDAARQSKVDLIVTSTHGRTGFKHLLIGSTAEYVVRQADCPVLVVPSHDRPIIKLRGAKL